MNQKITFLTKLDDYELAYFAKFNLSKYSKEQQEGLKSYIYERGLSKKRIEQLIKTNPKREKVKGQIRCKRCSSNLIL